MSSETEITHLASIARDYHLASSSPDMGIEALVQGYELNQIDRFIPDGCEVLEMGYGDGVTFSHLVIRTNYSLLEAVPELIGVAKARATSLGLDVNFHEGLFEEFVPEVSYDVVFASHVLEHVMDPLETLRKIKSWLKPTGIVIVVVPNAESLHRRLSVAIGHSGSVFELSARDHLVGHRRVYSLDSLRFDIRRGGFEVEHELGTFLKPLPNGELIRLSDDAILHLCEASQLLGPEFMANLVLIAKPMTR